MSGQNSTQATNEIASLMEHLLSSFKESRHSSAEAVYRQVESTPAVIAAVDSLMKADYEGFYAALKVPQEDLEEFLIETYVGADHRLMFVFQHSQFISGHLQNLFRKVEGNAYCVDKEGCVLSLYVRWLLTGEKIEFDSSAAYTFMYPKKILKDHESIVEFLDGLNFLYCGKPDKYLEQLDKIIIPAS